MAYVIGIVLALGVGVFASSVGLDRDRAFYPTVLMVIASFYALFAVMGGSTRALVVESVVIAAFLLASATGFKTSLWLVAAGLIAHGVFDFVHGRIISNPGVPAWWPSFCLAYDVAAGLYLAWLLSSGRLPARRPATLS